MKKILIYLTNKIYQSLLKRKYHQFFSQMDCAQNIQFRSLKRLLDKNKESEYGQKYQFAQIKHYEDFKAKVPIVTYDDLLPFIESIKNGRERVLTYDRVVMFEKTSGSSASAKYIPFTKELLSEIHLATATWIYDLYKTYPQLNNTTQYWSVSPKLGSFETTSGGLKVGFEDDSEYFSLIERFFLKILFTVPPSYSTLSVDEFRLKTALKLVADEHLGLISVWSPTFLIMLFEFIENNKRLLISELKKIKTLSNVRINNIIHLLKNDYSNNKGIDYHQLWPKLKIISIWTDGASSLFTDEIKRRVPKAIIQGKGLFLTEGIITIPLSEMVAPILSYSSHFYEFIDKESLTQEVKLPHELIEGRVYIPVITTSGGLYRYNTLDQVMVMGFHKNIPLLKFLGRDDRTVDLCGEKLNEIFVTNAIKSVLDKHQVRPLFALLSPSLTPMIHYNFYVEFKNTIAKELLLTIEQDLEQEILKSHHYQLARKLGQLEKIHIKEIKNGVSQHEKIVMIKKGMKIGNIKQAMLDPHTFWEQSFKIENR